MHGRSLVIDSEGFSEIIHQIASQTFDVRMEQPNKETIATMLEAERIARDPSVKRYSDVEDALQALKE